MSLSNWTYSIAQLWSDEVPKGLKIQIPTKLVFTGLHENQGDDGFVAELLDAAPEQARETVTESVRHHIGDDYLFIKPSTIVAWDLQSRTPHVLRAGHGHESVQNGGSFDCAPRGRLYFFRFLVLIQKQPWIFVGKQQTLILAGRFTELPKKETSQMNTLLKYLFKRKMMYTILFSSCILTPVLAGEVTHQAEDYTFGDDCRISTDYPGYNGVGFVDMGVHGSHFGLENIDAEDGKGKYALSFRYANGRGAYRQCQIEVNGEPAGHLTFPDTGSWSDWDWTTIFADLAKGDNTLSVTAETYYGGPNVDEVKVERIYRIDIQNGSGTAWAFSGRSLPIRADLAPDGQVFYKWKVKGKVKIDDKDSPETIVEVQKDDAVITATYKDIPEMCYAACDTKTEKCSDIGVDECIRECALGKDWNNPYVACMNRAETCEEVEDCDKFYGCMTYGPFDQAFSLFSKDPTTPTMLYAGTPVVWVIDGNCLPMKQDVHYREAGTKKWKKINDIEVISAKFFGASLSVVEELAYTLGPGLWDLKLVVAEDDYEPFYVKVPENIFCLEAGPNYGTGDQLVPLSRDSTAIQPGVNTWWAVNQECLSAGQTFTCESIRPPGDPSAVNLSGRWGPWSWIDSLADELVPGDHKCHLVIGDATFGPYYVEN